MAKRQGTNGQFAADPIRGRSGEETGTQSDPKNYNHPDFLYDKLWANGGNLANPMGYPGYLSPYWGTYPVYRWILSHPIVRLARAVRYGPVVSSSWEYAVAEKFAKNGDAEKFWLPAVLATFNRLRKALMDDFYKRGCDMGWAGGEPIWERSEGQYELVRVKPLLPDETLVTRDKKGNFTGLKNHDEDNKPIELAAPFKAWKYTYDSECGYPYGRSWLENIRETAWKDWLDTQQQLQRLTKKLTGVFMVILSPAGTFNAPDGSGGTKLVYYRDAAMKLMAGLAAGSPGGWMPKASVRADARGGGVDLGKFKRELAGIADTEFKLLDFGKQVDAIEPLLNRLQHNEKRIFAGALRSDRTGLEAAKGSRADAEIHTDTGTINAEEEDEDFATQCNVLVDSYLVANYGERARGAIVIKPPSLIDRKSQILRAFIMALLNNESFAVESGKSRDIEKIYSILDIPQKQSFNGNNLQVRQVSSRTNDAQNKDPQGGRPEATAADRQVRLAANKARRKGKRRKAA